MTDTTTHGEQAGPDLAALVGDWFDWATCGEALGVSASRVRQLIREHQLAAAVPEPGAGQQVPAAFVQDGVVVKGLPGVVTVLHDGGYDDRWNGWNCAIVSRPWLWSKCKGRPRAADGQQRRFKRSRR